MLSYRCRNERPPTAACVELRLQGASACLRGSAGGRLKPHVGSSSGPQDDEVSGNGAPGGVYFDRGVCGTV